MNRTAAVMAEIDELVSEGTEQTVSCREKAIDASAESASVGPLINRAWYQRWYSRCLPVVAQLIPERLDEFNACYSPKKAIAGPLTLSTYAIVDNFEARAVPGAGDKAVAARLFLHLERQTHILQAARDRAESLLADIRGTLQAEVFDDELSAASALCSKGHLRAGGAVAGVVLESHLQTLSANHGVRIARKAPTISELNDPLKSAGVYDTPPWRKVQHLGDLRNLCVHNKEREPTKGEVLELIDGVNWAIKNLF